MTDDASRLAMWCAGDDWCPVTTTARLIGNKWHPVIVHRLLDVRPQGFNELEESIDGVSNEVLSDTRVTSRNPGSSNATSSANSRSASGTR